MNLDLIKVFDKRSRDRRRRTLSRQNEKERFPVPTDEKVKSRRNLKRSPRRFVRKTLRKRLSSCEVEIHKKKRKTKKKMKNEYREKLRRMEKCLNKKLDRVKSERKVVSCFTSPLTHQIGRVGLYRHTRFFIRIVFFG